MARYDDLEAEQVLEHLGGLSQEALLKLGGYERAHRRRDDVLDRIAALTGDEPWPGYDDETVPGVQASLDEASRERLNLVLTYERAHKNRSDVLQTATHRLVMHAG